MTTVQIYCKNTGLAIDDLGVLDVVKGEMHDVGYIAKGDVKKVAGLNVRDAGTLVSEIEIFHDGVQKYTNLKILDGGNVDVFTGTVN